MKKLLSLVVMAATLSISWAQLPDNSIAPNFTVTDIDGESHSLQDYLDQGTTVVLNFGATTCSTCWTLNQTGNFKNVYNAFGPDGSGDIMYIWIESNPQTNDADLNGTGTATFGDWVTGSPYPIIDGNQGYNLSNTYQVPAYPTIYTICPSGILRETYEESWEMSTLVTAATTLCGNAVTSPAATMSYSGDEFYCAEEGWEASANLTNLGPIAITSATFEVNFNGNTEVVTYSGSLNTNGVADVNLGTFNSASGEIEATLVSLNGQPRNLVDAQSIAGSTQSTNQIVVQIMPDPYGYEVSWEILDDNNNIVAGATCDDPAAITWQAMSVVQDWVIHLPSTGCYTFKLKDSYGDGLTPGVPNGQSPSGDPNQLFYPTAKVYSYDGTTNVATILSVDTEQGDNYAYELVRGFEVTSISTGIEEVDSFVESKVFPNPTAGEAQVVYTLGQSSDVTVEVTNALGQRVELRQLGSLPAGEHRTTFDLSGLTAGMYNVVLRADDRVSTLRITKQ